MSTVIQIDWVKILKYIGFLQKHIEKNLLHLYCVLKIT